MCRGGRFERKEAKSEIPYQRAKDEFRLSIVLFPCFMRVASDGVLSDPIVENQRVEVLRQAHPIAFQGVGLSSCCGFSFCFKEDSHGT